MMFSKKAISILLTLVMLAAVIIIPGSVAVQAKDAADLTANAISYGLSTTVQDGNILHAFNWRMSDLVLYAPDIAAAGYSTVQISPIQNTKATGNDGAYATDWWSFYQPTDMKIGNALGTAEELKAAADELHKYGVKIIVDVVTNHVMNFESSSQISMIAADLKNWCRKRLGRQELVATSDSSRNDQTQNDMGGQLPDLNTENKDYQNYVINNLLLPLLDCGVDGFRFDAAKHIATPDDPVQSDYWPTITNAIRNVKSDAYIYGEILASANRFQISSYTKYINVTDYSFGARVRSALSSKNASDLVNYGYTGSQKSQNVLWVESHDNFCDGTTTVKSPLSKKQQILGWAVIGSRADAPALYFVRPKHEAIDSEGFIKYDELMGAPGAADTWKDPVVVAVNKFKNAFIGQSETTVPSGSLLYIQRGTTGMVIVNLNGTSTSINQSCSMANGTYTDQVTGNEFTVSGGKISGNVGSSGVAVVYNKTASNTAPTISLSLNGTTLTPETLSRYTDKTATVSVTLSDATSGTIKVSNLEAVTVSGGTTEFTLNSGIAYGKSVDIEITATNGTKTVSRTYNIKKKNPNETKKVYFDNSTMKWPFIYVYCKTGISPSTQIANYDAYQLTGDLSGVLSYTVPANTKYVKFNEGFIASNYTSKSNADPYGRYHMFHSFAQCQGYCGRTMPETVVNYGTANDKANRENGGYELVGAMILKNLRFIDYGEYPVATLSDADTSLTAGGEDPTEPSTEPSTEPATEPETEPSTEPYVPGEGLLRGDADQDGQVNLFDATFIQRVLVDLDSFTPDGEYCADVDSDGTVNIFDATYIQRYLVDYDDGYGIGTIIGSPSEPAHETHALPYDFVAVIYCESAGTDDTSRNSEHMFTKSTGTLTYDFIGPSYVFVRKYQGGIQYATNGWTEFANPVTLVNQANLTATFEKMYVPAGTNTLYLTYDEASDTCTLEWVSGGAVTPVDPEDPTEPITPVPGGDDITFIPGAGSKDDPAWFAWVWNGTQNGRWIAGVPDSSGNIIFAGAAAYTDMLIARMPTGSTEGDWKKCWNQSQDIKVEKGKTLSFNAWDGNNFTIKWIDSSL